MELAPRMNPQTRIRLSKLELKALLAFARSEKDHLKNVFIEPLKGRAFATDGHTLAMMRFAPPSDADLAATTCVPPTLISVPVSVCKSALKLAKNGEQDIWFFGDSAGSGTITVVDAVVPFSTGNEPPPVDQVIPAIDDSPRIPFAYVDAALLARVGIVGAACEDERAAQVSLLMGTGELGPVRAQLFSATHGVTWDVIVMPMRRGANGFPKQLEKKWKVDAERKPTSDEAISAGVAKYRRELKVLREHVRAEREKLLTEREALASEREALEAEKLARTPELREMKNSLREAQEDFEAKRDELAKCRLIEMMRVAS